MPAVMAINEDFQDFREPLSDYDYKNDILEEEELSNGYILTQ